MSGTRAITLTLSVRDADAVRRELERMGAAGESALKRLDDAAQRASSRQGVRGVGAAAQEATRSLESMAGRLGPLGSALSSVGVAGAAAAAGLAALSLGMVQVARSGDQMTQTLNQLRAATGSVDGAAAAYDRLYRLSLQTGVAVADSAQAFNRFSIAARDIGATNDDALRLVATMQRFAIVGGSSGQAASAAAGQLAQALASGVLQGDELRSLLENMPDLAQALSRELGVSVGQLRAMGSEGQLTADRVMPALLRAGERINEEFAKLPPTMSLAFGQLGVAMTRFAADLDRALGLSNAIARAVNTAATAVDGVRRGVAPTPEETARARVDAARAGLSNVDRLEAESAASGRRGNPAAFAAQRAAAVAEVEATQRDLDQIERDALVRRIEERDTAAVRAAENQRRRDGEAATALAETLNGETRARREHADRLTQIDGLLTRNAISAMQATDMRARSQERLNETLNQGARAATSAARATPRGSEADSHVRTFQRAQEREESQARDRREREERQELDRRERENERSTDSITRYLADGFADAFRETGGGFRGMLRTMQDLAVSTPIRIGVEAVARPVVSSLVSGVNGAGGLSSLLGLSGIGSSISGMLGLGGAGAGISGFLAAPLFGQGALAASTNSALGNMGGAFGPAAPSALGVGGSTVGGVLGPAALGFGAGMLTSNLTANSAAQRTNGMIGAAGGAAAGIALAPFTGGLSLLAGGIIGGAGGGALGGMFGPGRSRTFFNVNVGANDDGQLAITGSGGRNADERLEALRGQTSQQVAALNAQMAALGLRVSGEAFLGAGVGGVTQVADLSRVTNQLSVRANDARTQGAIDRIGGGDFGRSIEAAQAARDLGAVVDGFAQAARDATDPLGAVTRQFDGLRSTAERLGFGLEEVNAQQQRAIEQAREQLLRPAISALGGLADFARGLRTANDNTGNPLSRLAAADADFSSVAQRALAGDTSALARVQASAETFRGLSRDVFGTGGGAALAEQRILSVLEQIGQVREQDFVVSAVENQTVTLVDELQRLRAEVAALRADTRQAAANPLAARAA